MNSTIQDTKYVWVAWSNTDLTEGRGTPYPLYVTESPETAKRLGHKASVQGSDCDVYRDIAVKINNKWLIPGVIIKESLQDTKAREKREARERVEEKAKELGLSDEELATLTGITK